MWAYRYEVKEERARMMSMWDLTRWSCAVPEVEEGPSRVGVVRSDRKREMKVEGWWQGRVSPGGRQRGCCECSWMLPGCLSAFDCRYPCPCPFLD